MHISVPLRPLFLCSLLMFAGCSKKGSRQSASTENSGISAFTSGVISRESTIRVLFTEPVELDSSIIKIPQTHSPLSFSPAIKGTAIWLDKHTLEYRPAEPLKAGQEYSAKLNLPELYKGRKGKFEFSFSTMVQSFELQSEGLRSKNSDDLKIQQFCGMIITADVALSSDIEKMVSAEQSNKQLPIIWNHDNDRRHHSFTIDSIRRGDSESEIKFSWSGKPIGVDKNGSEQITIPALQSFTVVSARAVQGTETYLELRFSDPLDKNQNLNGLIQVEKSDIRFDIDNSIVKIYGNSSWAGTYNLTVEKGVRNSMKQKLSNIWQSSVTFEEVKPEVRFIGKGVIIPTTNGLTIPVEAVNVRAIVVEATRIFESTMPQFLQINDLEGNDELKRVGRVVWKKVVQLEQGAIKPNQWVKYGLDVTQLIADNPGGLYKIKLSFKRQHIVYDCPDQPTDTVSEENSESDNQYNENESSNWDYYEDENYDWDEYYNQRENPCHKAYYREIGGHTIEVSRNVLISDIGLIAKQDHNDTVKIITTDIKTAEPLPGCTIQLLDYQQQVIATGKTDRTGMLSLHSPRQPFLVIASNNNQKGYLRLDNGSSLPVSHFDVGGESIQKGIKGFLYGERGVWRPGDTLFLTFILHDPTGQVPAEHPVIFELYDSKNHQVKSIKTKQSVNGFFSFKIPTNESDPTGNWLAKVKVGGAQFEKQLKVETVMPNRLKIKLNFGKELLTDNEDISAILSSQWLHGAIARDLKADVELKLHPSVTKFSRYNDFLFDDPARKYEPETFSIFDGNLDENGTAPVKFSVHAENESPGALSAQFTTRVFEPGGAFSIDRFSIPFHPYSRYIGIRTPKGDKSRGMLLTDTTHTVQLVALQPDGSAAPSTKVQIKLFQIEWRWWWEKGDEYLADYASSSSYTPVICDTVDIRNGKGEWNFKIKYPSWGRYLIRAVDLDGNHATGKIVYIDWPGWAGRAQKDVPGGASVLNFSSDKEEYAVGEKVTLTIPAAKKGRGLISIENGSRILKQEWVTGESESMQYQFEATSEMTPNIYVSVTYLQPHLTSGNDVPIRTYGIISVKVTDPSTRLQPRIDMPEVLVPEETAKIKISESSGKQMTYTLAVVDEGLLDLTRFETPDPWDHFFKREALGITTWDMFDLVAGAYGATLEKLLSIGGDDENQNKGKKQANRFPPMVRFYGPFELQKGKTNEHSIDMPQYIGSVRVMVVAGQSGAFGNAEKTAAVRKPLMILGTLPRVLSIEETADLPVSVFALDPKIKNVQVTINTDGPLSISGDAKKQLSFSNPGDQVISFNAKAGSSAGVATVTIKAAGNGEQISQKIEINVRYPINPVTDVMSSTVAKGDTWKEKVKLPGIQGTNSVMLECTNVPPLNLGQRLAYLIQYPHGCIEQTTSSVFPQLYLDKLLELSPDYRTRIEQNIKSGIDRLRSFQTSDGGFSYWPGNQESDEWGSCYAGHFLVEAQKAGYTVPNGMMQQWIYYQQNKARSWVSGPYHSELIQAYRLFTLALAGNPDIGSMNRLREQQSLGVAEKWRLAACYQLAGQKQIAEDMVKGLSLSVKPYRELSETYGSDIRDKAMILEALVILNKMDPATQVAKELSNALSNSSEWYSTQTTAYTLTAMAKYTGIAGSGNDMSFSVSWNKSGKQNYTSSKPVIQIPLKINNETEAEIEIKNTGSSMLYSRLILNGIPEIGTEKSASNGLEMSVDYTTTKGEPISDITELEQGQDFMAIVKVKNTGIRGTYKEVALSHLVPSGWEIHNNRLSTEDKDNGFDFQDIRDDRVYTYFDIGQGDTKTFKILVNASYSGKYYLPMISAEAMYDATINARVAGEWITISKP